MAATIESVMNEVGQICHEQGLEVLRVDQPLPTEPELLVYFRLSSEPGAVPENAWAAGVRYSLPNLYVTVTLERLLTSMDLAAHYLRCRAAAASAARSPAH
jgi:hypothetical protein